MDNYPEPTQWKLLMVDDDEDDYFLVRQMLLDTQKGKLDLDWAPSFDAGREALKKKQYDAVLMDYDLGIHNGLELIHEAVTNEYSGAFILFTGRGTREVDMQAMEVGASLYLTKGEVSSLMLERGIRYAIERKQIEIQLRRSNENLAAELAERHRIEAILRENERKFQTIFQHSLSGVALSTLKDGRLVDVNNAWLELYGFRREEVIGRTSTELGIFFDPADRQRLVSLLRQDGFVRSFELDYKAKSGKRIHLASNMNVITLGDEEYLLATSNEMSPHEVGADHQEVDALEKSKDQLAEVLESINDGIFTLDYDWRFTYLNTRAAGNIKRKPEDLIGKNIWEELPEIAGTKHETHYRKTMQERVASSFELDGVLTDQSYVIRVFPTKDGIGVYWCNVTGLKNTEQELAAATERAEQNQLILDAIIEQMPVGVIVTNPAGSMARYNREMVRIWRRTMSAEENIEAHQYQAYHPDGTEYAPEEWPLLRSLKHGEMVTGEEMHIVRGDGTRGIILTSSAPICEPSGAVIAGVVIDVDISESKRIEQELRESERKYRELIQYAPVGIYEIDFRTKRFMSVNDSMCQLMGYEREELMQMAPMEILDEQGRRLFQERIQQWLKGEPPQENVEYHVRARDGREITAVLNVTFTRDENGVPLGATVVGYDITERKRVETMLRESNLAIQEYARRLEQSNKELEEFAMVASHDLQEPLRKIESFGALVVKNASPILGETELDYLDRMKRASARMRLMIDGLLLLSRVTTRGQPFSSVDLNQVVHAVVDDLQPRILQTGGRIEAGSLSIVKGDPVQLQQLFQNLIANALKYHRSDVPPVIKIYQGERDGTGEIVVEDNGIGFERRDAVRIFTPFQRLHSREEYEGTGIGLSICKKIVERHGGSIRAESQPGVGSKFIFTLPFS